MPRYYVTSRLSERISETPEGYLLCLDVPITRTGELIYGPGETPIEPGPDGRVIIVREEEDVFAEATLASFEGKSITIDHPQEDVRPDNWQDLTHGVTQNPRRGDGEDSDKLLVNFLITEPKAIADVKSGRLREVSCGYDAEYEQIEPGRGRQKNIRGNHVALVERGRAGPECAVRDSAYTPERNTLMKWQDRLKAAFGQALDQALEKENGVVINDEEEPKKDEPKKEDEPAKDQEGGEVEGRLSALEEGMAKVMQVLEVLASEEKEATGDEEELAEDEEPEEAKDEEEEKAMDSETVSRAEILAPGIAKGKNIKVRALEAAYGTKDGRSVIHKFTDGKKPDYKNKSTTDMLFIAVSEKLKDARADKLLAARATDTMSVFSGPMTPEKLNEINAARYGRK